jgi:hypothetical protein
MINKKNETQATFYLPVHLSMILLQKNKRDNYE